MFAIAFGLTTLLWFSIALSPFWLCVLASNRLFSCLTLFQLPIYIFLSHPALVHSCIQLFGLLSCFDIAPVFFMENATKTSAQ